MTTASRRGGEAGFRGYGCGSRERGIPPQSSAQNQSGMDGKGWELTWDAAAEAMGEGDGETSRAEEQCKQP